MIVNKLSVEVSKDIENFEKLFKDSPKKTEVAIDRTMRKLSKWTEVQVLRIMSRELQVTQKRMKQFGRIKTYLGGGYNGSRYLIVWIGTIPMMAHRMGRATQRARGVQVGRHDFYEGAFLMQPLNATRPLVFQRKDNWSHKWRKSKVSGRWMRMGLPIFSHKVPLFHKAKSALNEIEPKLLKRFVTLLHQELNYAFNIESRKSNS